MRRVRLGLLELVQRARPVWELQERPVRPVQLARRVQLVRPAVELQERPDLLVQPERRALLEARPAQQALRVPPALLVALQGQREPLVPRAPLVRPAPPEQARRALPVRVGQPVWVRRAPRVFKDRPVPRGLARLVQQARLARRARLARPELLACSARPGRQAYAGRLVCKVRLA